MNYTKGEWTYDKTSGSIKAINVGTVNNSPMVANVFVTDIIEQLETDVNARLISASPDMYEAIKHFMEVTSRAKNVKFSPAMGMAYCGLRNAIDKAEGR
jgi:hypothetical protein